MRPLRQLGFALWLALALVIGQHAGFLHALGHATGQMSHKQGVPAKTTCDQCFACAQLSGAAPTIAAFVPASADATNPRGFESICAASQTRVVFLSRAPPVIS